MQKPNNLLFTRLNNLSKDKFSHFESFVNSPYFHKGEKAVQFLASIKPYYPDFAFPKSVEIKIEKIAANQTSYSVLLSRINDLLDKFELYEHFNSKTFLKNSLEYELELEHKNNVKFYHQLQQSRKNTIEDSNDFYAGFYKEFASISVCENNWNTDKEKILFHSENAMTHILYFFLSKYLLIYANKVTHSLNITAQQKETLETEMLLVYVNTYLEKLPLSVQCVYYIIQLFKNIPADKKEFDIYFEKLKQQTFALPKDEVTNEIKYALIQASSACVFKCYTDPKYFENAFEIIQYLVEKDLYFSDLHELLIQQRFILIVKIALGANKVDWAKKFIEEKIHLIKKSSREDFYNYAFGLIYFQQHQYNDAVKLMVKINLNSAQFIADYKLTLLKMYYELADIPGFNYQRQTFLKFLGKDRSLNKTHQKNIIDSVELIRWLFKYKKNEKYNELSEKITSKNLHYLLANYRDKWFAEKYNALVKA
ncbi:MAG: hypothetical protein JWN78_241 [Bacteroidota bacterium]|nr:hypothetical protein [Bacteroidota bacterium]